MVHAQEYSGGVRGVRQQKEVFNTPKTAVEEAGDDESAEFFGDGC